MNIRFVDDAIDRFIHSLEAETIAKVLRMIDLLERFGHELGMPHSKSIGKGIFELRIRGVQEVRLLYCFHNGDAVLLHGFVKKSPNLHLDWHLFSGS